MAETNYSLRRPHQSNPYLCHTLDPITLVLSQNSDPDDLLPLKLTTECYIMERGPRYRAYAELRESKLRKRTQIQTESFIDEEEYIEHEFNPTPPVKKQVTFSRNLVKTRKGSSSSSSHSVLAQSVPDFSATLRKENRKPANPNSLPSVNELTPPSKNWGRKSIYSSGVLSGSSASRGSKSANAGEKKGGGMMRKSYASVEDLKKISMAASTAINGENRGGRYYGGRGGVNGNNGNKNILGYRQF